MVEERRERSVISLSISAPTYSAACLALEQHVRKGSRRTSCLKLCGCCKVEKDCVGLLPDPMSLKKKLVAAVAGSAGLAAIAYVLPPPPNPNLLSRANASACE